LIPIGDRPKNRPTSPSKPKLSATDRTISSTKSSLFLPMNNKLTRQYPGRKATKTKAKKYLGIIKASSELLGIR